MVGNVPTPVPIELDGKTHSLNLPLEPIASRTPAGGGYRLQLTSSTTVYDIQRSVGAVNLKRVEIALPVSQPTGR